ncbi:MAG: hypothetical protein IPL35_05335 [Sphingobacteriales bacterium]|nr:hypothetical protein [Sphingobacteriales bacterium]
MTIYSDFAYEKYEVTFQKGKLDKVKNLIRIDITDKFIENSIRPEIFKLYVLRDEEFYRFIGSTFKPIDNVLETDFDFVFKNESNSELVSYPDQKQLELLIWTFDGLTEKQIEIVSLELNVKINQKYNCWCLTKANFILDNSFVFGKFIANDIFGVLETYKTFPNMILDEKSCSNIIFEEPYQYGLRGDIYLWKELKTVFENSKINNADEFEKLLYSTFESITMNKPTMGKNYGVRRYNFGGMSSGMICSDFWIERGFPLLIERYENEKNNSR